MPVHQMVWYDMSTVPWRPLNSPFAGGGTYGDHLDDHRSQP
jgi:hypothetical protein